VYEHKIIHITDIVPAFKLVLNKLIQLIQVHVAKKLAA
jgi:hypothetical protein